jgi:hypothetical protein
MQMQFLSFVSRVIPILVALTVIVLVTYVYADSVNHLLGMVTPGDTNPGPDDLRRMVRMGVGIAVGLILQMILRAAFGAMVEIGTAPNLSKE